MMVDWIACETIDGIDWADLPEDLRPFFQEVRRDDMVSVRPIDGARLWRFPVLLVALPAPVRGFKDSVIELYLLETGTVNYTFTLIEDDYGTVYIYNVGYHGLSRHR